MAASCAQDGPRWRQDGHLGLNFGGFGAILGVTWTILGGLGEDLGGVLAHGWDSKNLPFKGFSKFFAIRASWKGLSGHLGDHVGRYCAQDGYKMDDFGQVGDLGGHLGAKMAPTFLQKNFRSRGARETRDRPGVAGGRGVSSGRVRVGINPTRVEL